MLDGAARLDELFDEVNRVGQKAIAITDHGYLFGAFEFWSKARAAGVKPIIGVEAYLTPGTARAGRTRVQWGERHQSRDDGSNRGATTRLTRRSRNTAGIYELSRMSTMI